MAKLRNQLAHAGLLSSSDYDSAARNSDKLAVLLRGGMLIEAGLASEEAIEIAGANHEYLTSDEAPLA